MPKPIFSEHTKLYLSRFLGGEMVHPTTPFEARVALERAAADTDVNDPNEALVRAAFLGMADRIDPPPAQVTKTAH